MTKKFLSFFALIFFVLSSQIISAQPWLYDFGTSEVTATNSNAGSGKTDLFENTPQGGGTYRVRIGAQGGEISVVNPGIGVGTDGELKMIAATGGSANKFSVYGWDSPSTGAYVKFELNTNSAGDGIFAFHLGNGGSDVFADNNTYTNYNHSVATFWIEYDSGEISSMKRRASGSTLTVQSHEFVKEQNQTVEIFANNASTAQFYSYDGVNYNLNSQSWDLWVDGVKVSEENGWSKGGNLEADENLAGFAAFAVNSTLNAAVLHMDNLEYSNALPAPVTGNQYAVNYSVVNGNGSVAASVDGVPIPTGYYVDEGSNVYFEATPDAGYQVLEWKLNSVSVQTGNSNYYFLENISSDANVTVEFEQVSTQLYDVVFDIKNQEGEAITDAIISLGEQTNEAGEYSFQVLSGAYNLTVVAQDYETYVDNNFLVTSDVNMPITLNSIVYHTISFVLKDENEESITNAIITLGDQTNDQGNYEFEIEAGVYNLSIIAQGYNTYSDVAFEVTANETVSITLNAEQIAELPIDFSGPWKGELPHGWTENELGGDYANGSAKFDNTGDWLMVHFNQEAAKMSHIIKANGTQWNGKFVVEQSADGQNWTEVVSYEGEGAVATTDTEFEYELNSDSRYLKWKYAEKISGNIGIANIKVMLPLNSYLVSYEVVGENGSLTASVGEEEIESGIQIEEGSTVVFKAMPDETHRVKAWYLNSQIVEDQTSVYYIVNDLSDDIEVKVEFEIDDTSIEENEIQTSIYPNPSNGKITIISNAICNMEVVDIQGRILHTSQILSGSNNLDLSHLNKGIYIVRLYNNQGTTSKTIIITD